jgi:hypothetical protein
MNILNRVIDSIYDADKLEIDPGDLETAISTQLKKILRWLVEDNPLLNAGVFTLVILLMVKHRTPDVQVPPITASKPKHRADIEAAIKYAASMAHQFYKDVIEEKL